MYLFECKILIFFIRLINRYNFYSLGILTLYSRALNLDLVSRLWDLMFVDSGTIILFKAAIGKILFFFVTVIQRFFIYL